MITVILARFDGNIELYKMETLLNKLMTSSQVFYPYRESEIIYIGYFTEENLIPDFENFCPNLWACENDGDCSYNLYVDPAMDNCIKCGKPYDRK